MRAAGQRSAVQRCKFTWKHSADMLIVLGARPVCFVLLQRESMDHATQFMQVTYHPRIFDPDSISLIEQLLTRDPTLRLGAEGAADIKAHPFFHSVDWTAMASGQLKPPVRPSLNSVGPVCVPIRSSQKPHAVLPKSEQHRWQYWATEKELNVQNDFCRWLQTQEYGLLVSGATGKESKKRRCAIM